MQAISMPTNDTNPMRRTSHTVPKSLIWKAIRARCLDCADGPKAVTECDGVFIGYRCALHPYRIRSAVKQQDEQGKLRPEFRKSALLKAIRRECFFCCNQYDPTRACSSPECSLHPFRRGTNYVRDSAILVEKVCRGIPAEDLLREVKGVVASSPEMAILMRNPPHVWGEKNNPRRTI